MCTTQQTTAQNSVIPCLENVIDAHMQGIKSCSVKPTPTPSPNANTCNEIHSWSSVLYLPSLEKLWATVHQNEEVQLFRKSLMVDLLHPIIEAIMGQLK